MLLGSSLLYSPDLSYFSAVLIMRSKDKDTPIEDTIKIMAVSTRWTFCYISFTSKDPDILQDTWHFACWAAVLLALTRPHCSPAGLDDLILRPQP